MLTWDMRRSCHSCCRCFMLLALLSLSAALPAQTAVPNYAYCHEMNHLLHWSHFPLRVYFSSGFLRSAERRKQALAGFDEWVHATHGVVCYQISTDEANADLTVAISSQLSSPQTERVLGQTILNFEGTLLTKVVIDLVDCDDEPSQFQEICAHEFGHALGIDGHSDDADDMMFPVLCHTLLQTGNPELDLLCKPGTVTQRDVNTLAAAYPTLGIGPKKH